MPIYRDHYKTVSLSRPQDFDAALADKLGQMSEEELEVFYMALAEADVEATLCAHEYDRDMVDMETWMDDPYYMGDITKSLYPVWRDDLIEIFGTNLYSIAVLVGSTGTGKSFVSQLIILRMVYEASCLANPARSYGLAKGSALGFCNIASSKETARRVVFEEIKAKMNESPYFREEFAPITSSKEEIKFDKNIQIIAGSSTDTSIIGMNIFGGVMDEGNFVRTGSNTSANATLSSHARAQNSKKAMRLYTSIVRRMKSRFNMKVKLPGILCVLSSKTTNDSFTEQIINKAIADNERQMFVRDRSLIDVKRDQFAKETFKVLVGNESYPSRILAAGEDPASYGARAMIIDVPEDLRKDFEDNMDESLRDLLGVSTMAISSFMSRTDLVEKMRDRTTTHPFVCPLFSNTSEWDSRLPYRIHWSKLARQRDNGDWEPIRNPDMPRVIHLDPASTGDAFGFAMGHISHFVPVVERTIEGGEVLEYLPFFTADFLLRIRGRPGEEVLFKNIRKLIYSFSEHGFHIAKITTDTYQSTEMLQALRAKGYKAEIHSMDTDKEPYRYFRAAIYDERVQCYDYPVLFHEVKGLEENPLKIDHRPGESKDLADAFGGVIWTISSMVKNQEIILPMKGISVPAPGPTRYVESPDPFHRPEQREQTRDEVLRQEAEAVLSLLKKSPRTVAPVYRKQNLNGTSVDLRTVSKVDSTSFFDPEEFMVRG